jgi:hypothetical protein
MKTAGTAWTAAPAAACSHGFAAAAVLGGEDSVNPYKSQTSILLFCASSVPSGDHFAPLPQCYDLIRMLAAREELLGAVDALGAPLRLEDGRSILWPSWPPARPITRETPVRAHRSVPALGSQRRAATPETRRRLRVWEKSAGR